MEGRGIKQDLIPYVRQQEFANVPIEGWVIDTNLHGFFDGSCDAVCLPTHYGEVVHPHVVICGVGMGIDGERDGALMFPESFPKGPHRFPYVLFITL